MIPIPDVPAVSGITAGTQIYICKGIPWDRQYKHVRLFGSKSAAITYCQGKAVYTTTTAKPIRDNKVSLPLTQGFTLDDCNYIVYNNPQLHDFWVLAFITESRYVSATVTEIVFEIDVFQTYFYSCTLSQCYVKRHHWSRSSDIIGANTLPEPVSAGTDTTYTRNSINYGATSTGNVDTGMALYHTYHNQIPEGATIPLEIGGTTRFISNVFSGVKVYADEGAQVQADIESLIENGFESSIVSIYMCPAFCRNNGGADVTAEYQAAFGSWMPRNNKMFTKQFCSAVLTDNTGANVELFYELAAGNNIHVHVRGLLANYPAVYAFLQNYDNQSNNYNVGIVNTNFPQCAVSGNAYQAFLNSNGSKIAIGALSSTLTTIGGILTQDIGKTVGGELGIASSVGGLLDKRRADESVIGSLNSDGVNYAVNKNRIDVLQKGMDLDSAKAADDFMSIYGYTTNDVVTPNLNTRNLWNYVETTDCNVIGDVAYNVREKLNDIFNSGVFIWHTNAIGTFNIGGNG